MDGDLRSDVPPSLLLMKGPPGSGKSTLARELGRRLHWPVIDKDDVRDLLPDAIGGISYEAMLAVARRQLQLGLSVIADSPLGYGESYRRAVSMAAECGARVAVIECVCSDQTVWRQRIEARRGMQLPAHHATDWTRVDDFFARTSTDAYTVDVAHLVVDTAGSDIGASTKAVLLWLGDAFEAARSG